MAGASGRSPSRSADGRRRDAWRHTPTAAGAAAAVAPARDPGGAAAAGARPPARQEGAPGAAEEGPPGERAREPGAARGGEQQPAGESQAREGGGGEGGALAHRRPA